MSNEPNTQPTAEMWAVVELMGHAQTAGRISRPADFGGLLRVDVPNGDGYKTEFYGMAAIYSVKLVSEQIARAYSSPGRAIVSYDTPIVTREHHESVVDRLRAEQRQLQEHIRILNDRLTLVQRGQLPDSIEDGEDNSQ